MSVSLTTNRYIPAAATGNSTVTVIITCYNYARYLRQAMMSALAQSNVDVDVIVVDDASTDQSLAVARSLAAGDSRVQVIANPCNLGAVGAFNRGLELATGQFVVRLDADDVLTPGSLARAAAALVDFPSLGLVYGHPLHFAGDELPAARLTPRWWDVWSGRDWLTARCIDGTNVITSPEVVMRRSVVSRVGGMRPLAHTHDMELWLRIAAHADVGYIGGADQAWHREHPDSLSNQAEPPLVILAELRAAFDELFSQLGPCYPDGGELHHLARQAVAGQALTEASRLLDRGQRTRAVDALRAFALETDPELVSTMSWSHFEAHRQSTLPAMLVAIAGTLPRLRRRVGARIRLTRWHRSGVYEPLRLVSGPSRPRIARDGSLDLQSRIPAP